MSAELGLGHGDYSSAMGPTGQAPRPGSQGKPYIAIRPALDVNADPSGPHLDDARLSRASANCSLNTDRCQRTAESRLNPAGLEVEGLNGLGERGIAMRGAASLATRCVVRVDLELD